MIPERWGQLLIQEKYQGEMACDMRNIIISEYSHDLN
jgi:hypothetical protein